MRFVFFDEFYIILQFRTDSNIGELIIESKDTLVDFPFSIVSLNLIIFKNNIYLQILVQLT